ncbi:MAG TPA: adenylate kinase [Chloroflexota bacterium]|nr:adenylate kinase [Chloroflexota bacterium]
MIVILLGAPGSGKGTQGVPLSEKLGLAHVASGDMFREHLSQGTELGKLAKSYMEKGELVPDDVTIRMIEQRLERPDAAGGVILDGFPRTLPQAEALEEALAAQGRRVDVAPFVQVSTDELLRRLGGRWMCRVCGRSYHVVSNPPKHDHVCDVDGGELYQREDDSIDVARKRLQVYFEQTQPLVDYYRDRGVLVDVNGEQSIEQVSDDLVAAIRRRGPESSAAA